MVADPRNYGNPRTGNQALFDAALRHQVGLRRFSSGEVRRILDLLERADRDLVKQLRDRLGSVRNQPVDFTSERLRRLLDDVRAARKEAMALVRGQLSPTLRKLSRMEYDFERRMIQGSMPFSIDLASVDTSQLRAIVTTQPFAGNTLSQWYASLASRDSANLISAIQLGLSEGQDLNGIVRRIAGTRARGYSDGVLALTRRNAETVARTAINGVSNAAREALWEANSDIVSALRWTSVLDGRTSPICMGRDGKMAPVTPDGTIPKDADPLLPSGARPPAHPACRSVMVASIDGVEAIGSRPTVTDTRTRQKREVDFRAMAKKQKRPIQDIRREWAEKNVGFAPARVDYDQWLLGQAPAFQDSVLGVTRGQLFRSGKLRLDQFVDSSNKRFTLSELSRTRPDVFESVGLSPSDF